MSKEWDKYLIEVMRENVLSLEAELEAVRNSVRFKIGGWVMQALPPGIQTVRLVWKLGIYYLRGKKRASAEKTKNEISCSPFNGHMIQKPIIVFGTDLPKVYNNYKVWFERDANLIAEFLDTCDFVGVLVLNKTDHRLLRRIERIRNLGWKIIWYPTRCQKGRGYVGRVAYVCSHADQVISYVGAE